MSIAVSENFAVVLLLRIAKTLNQIESGTHGFVGMLGVAIGKSENGDDALPIGRLYITARLLETHSYATKEFFGSRGESRGLGIPGQAVFIGDVADNDGRFVC